jgi:hypothetical protein
MIAQPLSRLARFSRLGLFLAAKYRIVAELLLKEKPSVKFLEKISSQAIGP